ncbi:MAG: DNA primase [bacterium]
MITEEQIIEIRQKADIVEIVSDYISLTRQGKNFAALCPFHNDKNNPSLIVSPEKQIFNCFTCKTGGDVFSFVSKEENINYYDAVRVVAEKIGYDLGIASKRTGEPLKNKKLYDIMNMSCKYYLNNINTEDGKFAKKYLNERGITDEIIKEFSLGVSLEGKNDLYSFLSAQEFDENDIYNLGLINRSGIDIYDSFKSRIMVPIMDGTNKVVGFTGRVYKNNTEGAKYINTKETIIFKKSDILYNYHNAKSHVRDEKKIIIVEGNMDAIKMASSGIKNVIALMGTFVSTEQINILKKLNCNIILLLDSDEAGYNATIKNGDIFLKSGIICDVIRLSDAKDPDEYIEKFGVEALNNNISSPMNYLDFKISDLKLGLDMHSSRDITIFIKELTELLKLVDDVTRNVIVSKVCSEYSLDKSLFNLSSEPKIEKTIIFEVPNVIKKDKYNILANKIIYYLISDVTFLKIYKKELNFLKNKLERDLVSEIDVFYKKNVNGSLADFLGYIAINNLLSDRINEIITDNVDEEVTQEKFFEYLILMRRKIRDDDIKSLKNQVKNELDVDKKIKLIEQLTKLKGSVDYE